MKWKHWLLALPIVLLCLMCGCALVQEGMGATSGTTETGAVAKTPVDDIDSVSLVDNDEIYASDDAGSVVTLYATVRKGSHSSDTDHTLKEVESVVNLPGMIGVEKLKAEVLFQEGNEDGPQPGMFGFGEVRANGTIRIRGKASTLAPQKSYRIDLLDNAGLWREQRAIALVKHVSDPSRLRNKLYFDLLKDVPDTVSLRTQFVHLYIKDETSSPAGDAFVDYGLFTMVETPTRRYLRNHGLNRDGNLYKANDFDFGENPEVLRLAIDPQYDLERFSAVIDPKNGEDHTKLLDMLGDVNDHTIPIVEVVDRHFNLDNMMSFLAFNILTGNDEYTTQNFYLYSPVNLDTWFFIPWDGDGAFQYAAIDVMGEEDERMPWQRGVAAVWDNVLFRRVFEVPSYREALVQRVEELRAIVTPEKAAALIETYRPVVDEYTHRMPDAINLPATYAQMEEIYAQMPYDIDRAYEEFIQSTAMPMPFSLHPIEQAADGTLHFAWSESLDFGGSPVQYDCEVATDWLFDGQTVVARVDGVSAPSAQVEALPPGHYWWRVVARNDAGATQMALDYEETATGRQSGVRSFMIDSSGQVVNSQ